MLTFPSGTLGKAAFLYMAFKHSVRHGAGLGVCSSDAAGCFSLLVGAPFQFTPWDRAGTTGVLDSSPKNRKW